jgi:chemotaxis protein methyltransferase CheR
MFAEALPLPHALSDASGLTLGGYRPEHVREQVRRALERERLDGTSGLVDLLRVDLDARRRFRRSIAVSVSGFFRDPHQFALLERELLPAALARDGKTRVWSAGCADGSELYSIGVLLHRAGALERSFLLGSDVLEENLAAARRGTGFGAAPAQAIRRRLRWEARDLLRDGPAPGKWQVVLCRNVCIYFDRASKAALHRGLADALARRGILLLGRSERVSDPASLGLERVAPSAYRKVA